MLESSLRQPLIEQWHQNLFLLLLVSDLKLNYSRVTAFCYRCFDMQCLVPLLKLCEINEISVSHIGRFIDRSQSESAETRRLNPSTPLNPITIAPVDITPIGSNATINMDSISNCISFPCCRFLSSLSYFFFSVAHHPVLYLACIDYWLFVNSFIRSVRAFQSFGKTRSMVLYIVHTSAHPIEMGIT